MKLKLSAIWEKEADTIDTNLIYALNCGAINAGPTYVFKTSRYVLDTAVKMDINRKPVKGKISLLSREKAFFDGMHSRCRGYKTNAVGTPPGYVSHEQACNDGMQA